MRRLLFFIVLLAAVVVAVGYYRQWFTLSTAGDDSKYNINVEVDKEKIKADKEKAGAQIKEQTSGITDKVKKGAETSKTDNKPRE